MPTPNMQPSRQDVYGSWNPDNEGKEKLSPSLDKDAWDVKSEGEMPFLGELDQEEKQAS